MMRTRIKNIVFMAAAAGLLLAATAEATTVTATFNNVSPGKYIWINPGGITRAGVYNFTQASTDLIGINPDFPNTQQFRAFCIDIYNQVHQGQTYTWELLPPLNNAPVPVPGGGQIDQGQLTDLGRLYTGFLGGIGGSSLEAAAFQACIWEIVFETDSSYGLGGGSFETYTVSVRDRADQMLSQLSSFQDSSSQNFLALVNPSAQDQLVIVYTGGAPTAIPEPLTMFGLFGGVAGVAGYVRRRRRRA